jgi:hypothetical protein
MRLGQQTTCQKDVPPIPCLFQRICGQFLLTHAISSEKFRITWEITVPGVSVEKVGTDVSLGQVSILIYIGVGQKAHDFNHGMNA